MRNRLVHNLKTQIRDDFEYLKYDLRIFFIQITQWQIDVTERLSKAESQIKGIVLFRNPESGIYDWSEVKIKFLLRFEWNCSWSRSKTWMQVSLTGTIFRPPYSKFVKGFQKIKLLASTFAIPWFTNVWTNVVLILLVTESVGLSMINVTSIVRVTKNVSMVALNLLMVIHVRPGFVKAIYLNAQQKMIPIENFALTILKTFAYNRDVAGLTVTIRPYHGAIIQRNTTYLDLLLINIFFIFVLMFELQVQNRAQVLCSS